MPSQEMSLDEFMGHKRSEGGGSKYAEDWKKRKPPIFDSWIHTRSKIASLWQHPQPTVIEYKDKQTQEKRQIVFNRSWNCWEEEDVLQAMWKRDRDTGRRIKPPVICPTCLLAEWTYEQIASGELDWCKAMFKYDAKDSEKPTVIHTGGMIGAYGRQKPPMSEKEMGQLRDAHIYIKDSWKEKQLAQLNYVFSVADNDKLENGVLPYTIPAGLGDAIKAVIHKAVLEAEDEGNPFLNPYCIRWEHHPDEIPSKKYDATKLGKIKLTDDVRKLIVVDDPPSIARVIARQNPIALRAAMEEACLVKGVPWDRIFGRAIKSWEDREGKEGSKADGTDFDTEEMDRQPAGSKAKAVDDRPCEECGEIIPAGAKKCPGCKVPVEVEGDSLPYG